jgi:hypothetical protein
MLIQTYVSKRIISLVVCSVLLIQAMPWVRADVPINYKSPKLAEMTKPQLAMQLSTLVSNIIVTLTVIATQIMGEVDKKQFSPEKLKVVTDFIAGFQYFVKAMQEIQEQQLLRRPNGEPVYLTIGDKRIALTKIDAHLRCKKGQIPVDFCTKVSCDTKQHCTMALMRDAFGYSYVDKSGKKVKMRGLLSEVIKILFTGYKLGGEKKKSLFELISELAGMRQSDRQLIVNTLKNVRRILKIVSLLSLSDPDQQITKEEAEKLEGK